MFRWIWHRHRFVEVERFVSRLDSLTRLSGGNPEKVLEAILGSTTILYRCEKCTKNKTRIIAGISQPKGLGPNEGRRS